MSSKIRLWDRWNHIFAIAFLVPFQVPSVIEGLQVVLLGMGMVFASLTALLLVMMALGVIFKPKGDEGEKP